MDQRRRISCTSSCQSRIWINSECEDWLGPVRAAIQQLLLPAGKSNIIPPQIIPPPSFASLSYWTVPLTDQKPVPYEPITISEDPNFEIRAHELQTPLGRTTKGSMASVAQIRNAALYALHHLQYEYDEETTMRRIQEGHCLLHSENDETDTLRNIEESTNAYLNDHLWDVNEGGIVTEWASCGNTGYRLGVQCKVEPMLVPTEEAPMPLS